MVFAFQLYRCSEGIVLQEKNHQAGHKDAQLEGQNLQNFKIAADSWSHMAIEAVEKLGLEQVETELYEEVTIVSENST